MSTRLGFNATFYTYGNINRAAQINQIELEPTVIGWFFPVEKGVWADAPTAVGQISAALRQMGDRTKAVAWTKTFQSERKTFLSHRDADVIETKPTQPSGLFKTLRGVLPKDAAITMDAGTLCLRATDALHYWTPKSLFTPLDFDLVGFPFACGLGVKCAQPDRQLRDFCRSLWCQGLSRGKTCGCSSCDGSGVGLRQAGGC